MAQSATYSQQQERDVVLRDGTTILLRPVRPGDRQGLATLYATFPLEGGLAETPGRLPKTRSVDSLIDVDYRDTFTLVGETDGQLIGTASYVRGAPGADGAEVVFRIGEAWQGRGIGTLLLERLGQVARDSGIERFEAWTRADNWRMLDVFRNAGFSHVSRLAEPLVRVSLDLAPTRSLADQHAARSAQAAHASIRPFFAPRSVAMVGASRTRGKVGAEVLRHVREGGFTGAIYPVNATATEIDGLKVYPSVTAIPGAVDLAVITVPASAVEGVVDECLDKGIKALVVISAGFAEVGPAGRALQDALVERVRRAGARLVGPNCMGVLNSGPSVRLNATFAPTLPPHGRVSMSTQSGALGLAVLDFARGLDLGISTFISVGNKADVSGNDLLQYWSEDADTDVVLLYLESFGNPRKFADIARRTSIRKPIVAVKAGRSQAGLRAAKSHTGALATDDAIVDALFAQSGVIRTHTLEELFDVARLLAHQPLPAGRRVAILTNAGGAGILAADACEVGGLSVPPLSEATSSQLRSFLPATASLANPIDMIASAPPEHYARAIPILLADQAIDSLLVIYVPPALSDSSEVAGAIATSVHSSKTTKPILVSFVDADGAPETLRGVPTYTFPEPAATALARVTAYATWKHDQLGISPPEQAIDCRDVRAQLQSAVAAGAEWLDAQQVDAVLRGIGVPVVPSVWCGTEEEAVAAATRLGFPVVLKAVGREIVHKTEAGAVVLNLADETGVADACRTLSATLGAKLESLLVQKMAPDGPEFLVGCVSDPLFGPVIACGAGGTLTELLHDVAFRLPPLGEGDIDSMVETLRSVRLLRGFRGDAPRDERALKDVLARVSALVGSCPEIVELDLNPVRVYHQGAEVLDARIRVGRGRRELSRQVEY